MNNLRLLNESNLDAWFITTPPITGITIDKNRFPDFGDKNKKLSVEDAFEVEYGMSKSLQDIPAPTDLAEDRKFVTTLAKIEPAKRVLLWETRATKNLLWTNLIGTGFDPHHFSPKHSDLWVSRSGSFVRTVPEPFLGFVDQSDLYSLHPDAKGFAKLAFKAQDVYRPVPDFLVFEHQIKSRMMDKWGTERSLHLHFTACRWLVTEYEGKPSIMFILFFPNAFATHHMIGFTGWQEGMVLDPLGALLCGMQRHVSTTTSRPLEPMARKAQKGNGNLGAKPKTLYRAINLPTRTHRTDDTHDSEETKVQSSDDTVVPEGKNSSAPDWRGSWTVKAHTRRIRNKKTGEIKVVEVKAFTKQKHKAPMPTVYIVSR